VDSWIVGESQGETLYIHSLVIYNKKRNWNWRQISKWRNSSSRKKKEQRERHFERPRVKEEMT
jgi:hypothetical protein